MSKILFPLRSNVEFFQNSDLKGSILDRLKHSLLLYDEIIIEDGTYVAEITESGSFCPYFPPGSLQEQERIVECKRDIEPGNMQVGIQVEGQNRITRLMGGTTIARYKIDYHEFVKQLDLESCNFIRLVSIDKDKFPKEAKQAIKSSTWRDKNALKEIHSSGYLRNVYINNLNHDLVLSVLLDAAVVLDRRHLEVLKIKCASSASIQAQPNLEEIALRQLLSVVVPDLGEHSIMDVVRLRMEQQWSDFRGFVSEIVADIKREPLILFSAPRIREIVDRKINRALFDKLKDKSKTGTKLAVDIGFGLTSLIPVISAFSTIASAVKSGGEYFADKSGWFAFLLKIDASSE